MIYGWIGKILKINLTEEKVKIEDSCPYLKYLGGRGFCARIAWEEIPANIDAYDPTNKIIFATGPLTGTLAPTAGGRFEVAAIGPQVYPQPRYTRSSVGGFWGAELKYAGFDAVVIEGRSKNPQYLWIKNGEVEFNDAGKLWGLDTFTTQKLLKKWHGEGVETLCIGQAGENLVRISTIQSNIESAAGQGGFGAVMGSKNLKALTVSGTGGVFVADPDRLIEVATYVNKMADAQYKATWDFRRGRKEPLWWRSPNIPEPLYRACTMSCTTPYCLCSLLVYKDVPGYVVPTVHTGAFQCVTPSFIHSKPWEAGFEAALFTAMYGINAWELCLGIGRTLRKFLTKCRDEGSFTNEDSDIARNLEQKMETGEFWSHLIKLIAYKNGIGKILSEGSPRADKHIAEGKEPNSHVARGFASHWDGHNFSGPAFPYWLVSALQWATDSRDPFVHGYAQELHRIFDKYGGPLSTEKVLNVSRKVYGSEMAVDPNSGYQYKVEPSIWHQNRSAVKDSLSVCDQIFPILYSLESPDGVGDPSCEAQLFSAVSGIETNQEELDLYGDRIFTQERAIMVREGRGRKDDEEVIPYFEKPDRQGIPMDPSKFKKILTEYYGIRKWDPNTGWPTLACYDRLDLRDVAVELQRCGRLPH